MNRLLPMSCLMLLCSCTIVSGKSGGWTWFGKDKSHVDDQRGPEGSSKEPKKAVYDSQSVVVLSGNGGARGKELLERLEKEHTLREQTCWSQAYAEMESTCAQILADEEVKSRFALKLSHCFLSTAGRRSRPCPSHLHTRECTARLDSEGIATFRAFFIDSTSACHILQSGAFRQQTERVINALKGSAEWVEDQLALVAKKSDAIFEASSRSLALHQQLQDNMDIVRHGLASVADEQEQLAQEQKALAILSSAMARNLSHGHTRLFQGQRKAIDGLMKLERQNLAAFESMRLLTEFSHSHHEEMVGWQGDMGVVQERLLAGSATLMQAQESFSGKMREMFTTLDQLFDLYNRMVIESRLASSLLFSLLTTALVYMLTSTSRTAAARLPIFFVLVLNSVGELLLARSQVLRGHPEVESTILSRMRNGSCALAIVILIYCTCTFRDYAALNFRMMQAQERQLFDLRQRLDQWLAPPGTPIIVPVDGKEEEAEDEPRWLGYHDAQGSAPSDSDDPDYVPPSSIVTSVCSGPAKHPYSLRRSARRRGRKMAGSAAFLAWEKTEDFVRLLLINSSSPLSPSPSLHQQQEPLDATEHFTISDSESRGLEA